MQVRARIRDDLEGLMRFAKALGVEVPQIISTPTADYAFRSIIDQTVWVKIAAALAGDIGYTNFKNEIHGEEDRDAAYSQVWSTMNDFQRKRARSGGGRG